MDEIRELITNAVNNSEGNSEGQEGTSELSESSTGSLEGGQGGSEGSSGTPSGNQEGQQGYLSPSPTPPAPPVGARTPAQTPPGTQPPIGAAPKPDGTTQPLRAPGSMKPEAREKWAQTPPEVQQEFLRRDREATRALTASTEARNFQNEFNQTIQPYLGFIAAENSTPLQAVNYMMQSAALLRVGTPHQKANWVAEVCQNFGIDLEMLDNMLAGKQMRPDPQTLIDQAVQQRLAPFQQQFQQLTQQQMRQEQQLDQEVDQEFEEFANATNPDGTLKYEFFHDVREMMADIFELAGRRNEKMDLTTAYQRATMMHEPVRRIIEGRKQSNQAQQHNQRAQQAKGAALSLTSSQDSNGTVIPEDAGDTIRGALQFAMAHQQGGSRA